MSTFTRRSRQAAFVPTPELNNSPSRSSPRSSLSSGKPWRKLPSRLPQILGVGTQSVGEIRHDAVDAKISYRTHFLGEIHGPGGQVQIRAMRLLDELRCDYRRSGTELSRAHVESSLHRFGIRLFDQKPDHDRRIDPSYRRQCRGVEGNHDGSRGALGSSKGRHKRGVHPPSCAVFQLQIENDVMLAGEIKNFLERGNALARICPVIPQPGIDLAELRKSVVLDSAVPVGGSLKRTIVDRDKPGIARQMKVGLDEPSAQLDRAC